MMLKQRIAQIIYFKFCVLKRHKTAIKAYEGKRKKSELQHAHPFHSASLPNMNWNSLYNINT